MKGKVPKVQPDPKYMEAAVKITPLVDDIVTNPEFLALADNERFLRMMHVVQTVIDFKVQTARKNGARMTREQQDTLLLMLGYTAYKNGWLDRLD